MNSRDFTPFDRKVNDDDWDDDLPCEKGPGCDNPQCPTKLNRDAMRVALGTVVEGMELVANVQALALDFWGECSTPGCTFEAEMQTHFSNAGKALGTAFVNLLDGIEMWKALPTEWTEAERIALLQALAVLKGLEKEALRQAAARRAGSPDPRDPTRTPKSN